MAINLNDQNFSQEIEKLEKPILVDFWTDWCLPCRIIGPILEKIAEELKEKIILVKVNLEESPKISQEYQIDQIPTVMLFKGGKPKSFFIGLQSEENIKKWLEENI
jgi:thioredoxin 1